MGASSPAPAIMLEGGRGNQMTGLSATLLRALRRKRWRCDLLIWDRNEKKTVYRNVLAVKRVRWADQENALALRISWKDASEHVTYVPFDCIRTLTELWTPRYPLSRIRERVGM